MGRKDGERCIEYRRELERSKDRLAELDARGAEALSRYDREVAFRGDDERALAVSRYLVANHVAHFTRQLEKCPQEMFGGERLRDVPGVPESSTHTAPPKEAPKEPLARQAPLFELPS